MNILRKTLIVSCLLSALVCYARHDGRYLREMTMDYVTPHLKWLAKPDKSMKILFILPRQTARDGVEFLQRFPAEYQAVLTYSPQVFVREDIWESSIEGTSVYEKHRELNEALKKPYDLIIIGSFMFPRLPEEAQYRILTKVTEGTGLLFVEPGKFRQLPYKKLYQTPLSVQPVMDGFSKTDSQVQAWQLEKGRVVHLNYNTIFNLQYALVPRMEFTNEWQAKYESHMALLGALAVFTAGKDLPGIQVKLDNIPFSGQVVKPEKAPEKFTYRIRDAFNNILQETTARDGAIQIPALSGGKYYCDILGANNEFGTYQFQVASPAGKPVISVAEKAEKIKPLSFGLKWDNPLSANAVLKVSLSDSPYGRIWHRQEFKVVSGAVSTEAELSGYYIPTIAGFLRCDLVAESGQSLFTVSKGIFFPDTSLDDYLQISWDTGSNGGGMLGLPLLVDRLGFTLGLAQPSAGIADDPYLGQKIVAYMVRIVFDKGKNGGVRQSTWHFLPSKEEREKIKSLNEDECFYDPEVQHFWKEGIKHRMQFLKNFSVPIYNLGDENYFSYEAGYGQRDLPYFREFLKGKYQKIATLNHNWKSNYQNFDEVPHLPMKEARDARNFAAWSDHRQYMEKMYADAHHMLAAEVKKYVPNARVGAEGSIPGDLEQTIENLEFWGPYSNLIEDELLRSFGGDRIRTLWWGGYPGGRSKYPSALLGSLLKGTVNGNAWYIVVPGDNHALYAGDLTIADYARGYLPYFDMLRRGVGSLLINDKPEESGLYIYWSHPSTAANQVEARCGNPSDSTGTLIRHCYSQGINFEFVSARTLDRLKKARLLFLPGAGALSDKECRAIVEFVKDGGTVIADVVPALFNENLREWDRNPLAELFGPTTLKDAKARTLQALNLNKNFKGQNIKFAAAKGDCIPGAEYFQVRTYGKGTAVLLNFALSSAAGTAESPDSFRNFLTPLLTSAGIKLPEISGQNAMSTIRFRTGDGFRLIGALVPTDKIGSAISVKLPGKQYIYECGTGFAGEDSNLNIKFKDTPFRLFAVFPQKQDAPQFTLAAPVRGQASALSIKNLQKGRIYAVSLFAPDGTECWNRMQLVNSDKNTTGKITVPFAYNDPTGKWRLVLLDAATGLRSQQEFTIK